jgi:phenylalanyl-tRNA synthetase alpha chain
MSTADRIAALRAEGEAAVAAATATAELEEVRVRFLGRKAELPNLLRDVGKLPPEERGPVGKGANQARQALQAAVDARAAELEQLELEQRLAADVVDVTLPGKVVAACDEVAHIPIRSESLNAGMAATVALYELDRRIRGHG